MYAVRQIIICAVGKSFLHIARFGKYIVIPAQPLLAQIVRTRFTPDLSGTPALRHQNHMPIFVRYHPSRRVDSQAVGMNIKRISSTPESIRHTLEPDFEMPLLIHKRFLQAQVLDIQRPNLFGISKVTERCRFIHSIARRSEIIPDEYKMLGLNCVFIFLGLVIIDVHRFGLIADPQCLQLYPALVSFSRPQVDIMQFPPPPFLQSHVHPVHMNFSVFDKIRVC